MLGSNKNRLYQGPERSQAEWKKTAANTEMTKILKWSPDFKAAIIKCFEEQLQSFWKQMKKLESFSKEIQSRVRETIDEKNQMETLEMKIQ